MTPLHWMEPTFVHVPLDSREPIVLKISMNVMKVAHLVNMVEPVSIRLDHFDVIVHLALLVQDVR